jgi:LmbE family N-acetylglucosaminyl deacetylase
MMGAGLQLPDGPLRLLCIGAHADDIEIGAGGTLLTLLRRRRDIRVAWRIASAEGGRLAEATSSAQAFAANAASLDFQSGGFRDGYLPWSGASAKEWLAQTAGDFGPDLVLTHYREDAHQDHRLLSEITWSLFRNALILEYEIPKWDGDLGRPNVFVPIDEGALAEKRALICTHFPSQSAKDWFKDGETFTALARLRGVECRAPYAEGFHVRKTRLAF